MRRAMLLFLVGVLGYQAIPDVNFSRVLIYYGWVTSDLPFHNYDILVFADCNVERAKPVYQTLVSQGKEVYLYLHENCDTSPTPVGLGSDYNADPSNFQAHVQSLIDWYATNFGSSITGLFFDECEPGYWDGNCRAGLSDPKTQDFASKLQSLISYAHSKGYKVFLNGVRGFASYGDYYLWESFGTTWDCATPYCYADLQDATDKDYPFCFIMSKYKYYYLRDNNLLDKTVGHAYWDPSDMDSVSHYLVSLARLFGLRGISISDQANMTREMVYKAWIYKLGRRISYSESGDLFSGHFTNGSVSVDVSTHAATISVDTGVDVYDINTDLPVIDVSDAYPVEETYQIAAGSGTGLTYAGTAEGWEGTGVAAEVYQGIDGDEFFHAYFDTDLNGATGYLPANGAEYMVECPLNNWNGSCTLYVYPSTGSDWSQWQQVYALDTGYEYSTSPSPDWLLETRVALPPGKAAVYFDYTDPDAGWAAVDTLLDVNLNGVLEEGEWVRLGGDEYPYPCIVDGNDPDIDDSQDLNEVFCHRMQQALATTLVDPLDENAHIRFYVDTDLNDSTGDWHGGAEYLVEVSLGYCGISKWNGSWSWLSNCSFAWNDDNTSVEVSGLYFLPEEYQIMATTIDTGDWTEKDSTESADWERGVSVGGDMGDIIEGMKRHRISGYYRVHLEGDTGEYGEFYLDVNAQEPITGWKMKRGSNPEEDLNEVCPLTSVGYCIESTGDFNRIHFLVGPHTSPIEVYPAYVNLKGSVSGSLTAGVPSTVTITIQNTGTEDSPDFNYSLYVDGNRVKEGRTSVPAGSSVSDSYTFVPEDRNYDISLVVDEYDEVPESDEADNNYYRVFVAKIPVVSGSAPALLPGDLAALTALALFLYALVSRAEGNK